jgi:hypothetical protein
MTTPLSERLRPNGPKRVLALDGGGVRGIISIAFLKEMETLLKARSGRGDAFRLCDYFDLVGGTSVGSLIATLIALGHTVSEIDAMFRDWAPGIFRQPWFTLPLFSPRFSSLGLKKRAREVLKERTLDSTDLKTGLAIIAKRVDTGSPWVLTNNPNAKYWNDPTDKERSYLGNRHYRLADVVCASTAAPYYFAPKRIRIVNRTRSDVKEHMGLFVDGGVSPFNNPALMLLMLAGIKGYGFHWPLGSDQLFLVSVGTGTFRMGLKPQFLARRIPGYFAARALQGLIGDSDALSLTLMQWLSAPRRRWDINSEIGALEGELLSADPGSDKPFLSFVRYDVRLEKPWLASKLKDAIQRELTDEYIGSLQQLDRPDMMDELCRIGQLCARDQVTPDDFPARFDRVS